MNKSITPIRLREARKMCGYSLDQLVIIRRSRPFMQVPRIRIGTRFVYVHKKQYFCKDV